MVTLDLYPKFAGALTGIDNTIAQFSGVISPLLTGATLDMGNCPHAVSGAGSGGDGDGSCHRAWLLVFWTAIALYLGGVVFFATMVCCDANYRKMGR